MVIINSYSSTPEKPRWRVFIPTTIAMPIAAHKAIGEQIMRTLNRAGYWSKKQLEANERIKSRKHHGFDMGKLTPSSLFYLPCQAREPGGQLLHRPQLARAGCRSIPTSGLDMPPTIIDRRRSPWRPQHRRAPPVPTDAADRLPETQAGCAS